MDLEGKLMLKSDDSALTYDKQSVYIHCIHDFKLSDINLVYREMKNRKKRKLVYWY